MSKVVKLCDSCDSKRRAGGDSTSHDCSDPRRCQCEKVHYERLSPEKANPDRKLIVRTTGQDGHVYEYAASPGDPDVVAFEPFREVTVRWE